MPAKSVLPNCRHRRHRRLAFFAASCFVILGCLVVVWTSSVGSPKRSLNSAAMMDQPPRTIPVKERQPADSHKPAAAIDGTGKALEHAKQSRASNTAMQGTSPGEQQSLWQAFHDARHAVQTPSTRDASMPENQGVRYFIANPAQDLTVRFSDEGARLQSGKPGRDWQVNLHLRMDSGSPMRSIQANGARIEYRSDGVTEWYENRREGIEHGFTLSKRPSHATSSGFSLLVDLTGLRAETEDTGDIRLVDQHQVAVARYSALKVWDALGKELDARMDAQGTSIAIHVADSTARYPLTIDPFITSLEQKLAPEMTGDGAANDQFGRSLALDGDTALIPNAAIEAGRFARRSRCVGCL